MLLRIRGKLKGSDFQVYSSFHELIISCGVTSQKCEMTALRYGQPPLSDPNSKRSISSRSAPVCHQMEVSTIFLEAAEKGMLGTRTSWLQHASLRLRDTTKHRENTNSPF